MLDIDHIFHDYISRQDLFNIYCSLANSMSCFHKSPATVIALPKAKHINGLVSDTHSHFYDDIRERTDRLLPTQMTNKYGLELSVDGTMPLGKACFPSSFAVAWAMHKGKFGKVDPGRA